MSKLILKILTATLLAISISACTLPDILTRLGGGEDATQGYVVINPDQQQLTLPAMGYYFYPHLTGEQSHLLSCDGTGRFKGYLPIGQYYTIATNIHTAEVQFSGMKHYQTAKASMFRITNSDTRAAADIYYRQPGEVYTVAMPDLTVVKPDTLTHTPQPAQLTRTISLTFVFMDGVGNQVSHVSGVFRGAFPAVYLYDGRFTTEEEMAAPHTALAFISTPRADKRIATLTLFGIYNPDNGANYDNILTIDYTLDGVDGRIDVSLTRELTKAIRESGGTIPLYLPLEIQIGLQQDGTTLTATVLPWKPGGESEGVV